MIERRTILKATLAALVAPVGVAIAKVLPKSRKVVGKAGDMDVLAWRCRTPLTPELLDDDLGMDPVLREKLKKQWYEMNDWRHRGYDRIEYTVEPGEVTGDGQFLTMKLLEE